MHKGFVNGTYINLKAYQNRTHIQYLSPFMSYQSLENILKSMFQNVNISKAAEFLEEA